MIAWVPRRGLSIEARRAVAKNAIAYAHQGRLGDWNTGSAAAYPTQSADRDHQQNGAQNPQPRICARSPVPTDAETTLQGRHHFSDNSALCTTAGIVWPVAPSVSSASVTASLLFAHMGAPIAVGTCNWADHTDFYPAGAGTRTPPAGQALAITPSSSRSSRSTRPSTGSPVRRLSRAGSSGHRTLPLQHQGVSEPHRA